MKVNEKLCKNIALKHMFWIFVRIARQFLQISKTYVYEEIIKQRLSHISFSPLRIFHNSKFILMTMSLGTNAVVVTRIQCSKLDNIPFLMPLTCLEYCWILTEKHYLKQNTVITLPTELF